MKILKKMCWVLAVVIVLTGSGIVYVMHEKLPILEYPLSRENITQAILECELPNTLTIEENDVVPPSGWAATSYTLRHQVKEIYAGHSMGILSNKQGDIRGLGLNITTIDEKGELTEVELKQSVIFATYLFGGFKNKMRVYNSLKGKIDMTDDFTWMEEIDGITCQVKYKADVSTKLFIAFSTDWDAFYKNQND